MYFIFGDFEKGTVHYSLGNSIFYYDKQLMNTFQKNPRIYIKLMMFQLVRLFITSTQNLPGKKSMLVIVHTQKKIIIKLLQKKSCYKQNIFNFIAINKTFYSVKMLFAYINCHCEWSDNFFMLQYEQMIYLDITFFFWCVYFVLSPLFLSVEYYANR